MLEFLTGIHRKLRIFIRILSRQKNYDTAHLPGLPFVTLNLYRFQELDSSVHHKDLYFMPGAAK